jgi:3-oxoacid CoA-transferase subunit A/glutaconate CoA-transferase subunit A
MPYLYFFDEEHIAEWLERSRTPEGADEYLEQYVFGVDSFEGYLDLVGGEEKLRYLKRVERLEAPMRAPWIKVRGG